MDAVETEGLAERARALRRSGLSTAQIAARLGVAHNGTLAAWLIGTPPPGWTARPRAKDAERAQARALRTEGATVPEIARTLGVARSTAWRWVADLPRPSGGDERSDLAAGGGVTPRRAPRGAADEEELRAAAAELRLSGVSLREIKKRLGIGSDRAQRLLADVPVQEWRDRRRPRPETAETRERARTLHTEGWTLAEIAAELHVSRTTCANWCSDVMPPTRLEDRQGATLRRSDTARRRDHRRQQEKLAAAREIGAATRRDVIVAAAVAYWCEGTKDKPYERRERLRFVNSDPRLVRLWLRFLDEMGVEEDLRRYYVHIHETADCDAATAYWAQVIGVAMERFGKPQLKRHEPRSNRRNVGASYHGCLVIDVCKSAELYRRVEGWFVGTVTAILDLAVGSEPAPVVPDWTAGARHRSAVV